MTYSKSNPCPVQQEAENVKNLSRTLTASIRKLRRSMASCKSCAAADDCPFLASLSGEINTAIQEIADEWNLAANA
jgi:hypothetical protein